VGWEGGRKNRGGRDGAVVLYFIAAGERFRFDLAG
jgi:hypothetical protein